MASQRPDKATTELLRQSLAPNPAANGPCPEPEVLAAYFERSLSTEETARCELHLSGCVRCREELALMERAGEHTATGEESRSAAGRRLWIWDWRWLAPAAAVLIFATIWIVRRPSNSNRESQTLVAMSRPAEPLTKEAPIPSRAPGQGGAPAAPAPKSEMAQNRALNKTQNAISRQTIQPSTNEKMHEATSRDARGDADSNLPAKSAGAPQIDSEERAARKETESKALADALQTDRVSPAAAPPPPVQTANAGAMVQGEADESAQALKSKQQIAAAAGPNLYAKKDTKAAPEPGGMGGVARVVRTPDPKVLWQVSEQGLLKSEDGGATWRPVDLPVANARVVFIAAPSAQVCWLVGNGGLILLTADGTHWQTVAPPAGADFVRVAAENASSATVSTAEGRRFQTSDGGKHWTPIQ